MGNSSSSSLCVNKDMYIPAPKLNDNGIEKELDLEKGKIINSSSKIEVKIEQQKLKPHKYQKKMRQLYFISKKELYELTIHLYWLCDNLDYKYMTTLLKKIEDILSKGISPYGNKKGKFIHINTKNIDPLIIGILSLLNNFIYNSSIPSENNSIVYETTFFSFLSKLINLFYKYGGLNVFKNKMSFYLLIKKDKESPYFSYRDITYDKKFDNYIDVLKICKLNLKEIIILIKTYYQKKCLFLSKIQKSVFELCDLIYIDISNKYFNKNFYENKNKNIELFLNKEDQCYKNTQIDPYSFVVKSSYSNSNNKNTKFNDIKISPIEPTAPPIPPLGPLDPISFEKTEVDSLENIIKKPKKPPVPPIYFSSLEEDPI